MNHPEKIEHRSQENKLNGFKADEIITCTDYKGNKNTFYKKTVGNSTYSCLSLEALKIKVDNHKEINHDAAAEWYGKGMYTGD